MYTKSVILEGKSLQFEKRSQKFQKSFQHLIVPDDVFGFLATALPTNDDIRFDRVFHNNNILSGFNEKWHSVTQIQQPDRKVTLDTLLDRRSLPWRPQLRAARADSDNYFSSRYPTNDAIRPLTNLHKEINCNGLVEFGLMSSHFHTAPYTHYVSPRLLIVTFANLIAQIHRTRLQADRPTVPYTIKTLIYVKGSSRTIGNPGVEFGDPLAILEPGITTFPPYDLNDVDDATNLLNLFHLDLYHLFGYDLDTDRFQLEIKGWPPDESPKHEKT